MVELGAVINIERFAVADMQQSDELWRREHQRPAQVGLHTTIRAESIRTQLLTDVNGSLDEGDEFPGSRRKRGTLVLEGEALAIAVELTLTTQREKQGDVLDDVLALEAGNAQAQAPAFLDAHEAGLEVDETCREGSAVRASSTCRFLTASLRAFLTPAEDCVTRTDM